ncbi:stage II sporulation protein P [Brevibacillus sp. B_LB10_24]|uniref:stage II sporulation protein P n=1 Tax=Brevibacillus sp. B_LB10_24 TaxID=3380645 RepID=UPI0038B9202D
MLLRKTFLGGSVVAMLLIAMSDPAYGAAAFEMTKNNVGSESVRVDSRGPILAGSFVKIVDNTNLRRGPGLEYDIVGKAKPGDSFPIAALEGEWYNITLPSGVTAYVASWVVQTDTPAQIERTDTPAQAEQMELPVQAEQTEIPAPAVNIIDNTNLRSGPGLEHDIVGKAKPGDSFPIVGTQGDWHQVSLPGGNTAYVASWVVTTNLDQMDEQGTDKKVYVYHTHNRESWKNVARNQQGTSIDDPAVNITLVGKQIGKGLQERGIATLVGNDDFAEMLKKQNLSYALSYAESRKAISKAIEVHPSLNYFFDIHRDADVPRKDTTVTINGKSYARILFVIGTAHPNYAENKKLAEALHQRLNQKYPGLSRGVLTKSAKQGNGEYNQSISPGSLLMEFGGVNNTLEESLLAAEAFSDVFAEFYGSAK